MNILLIMADELSTWGLGCYGDTTPQPPHLDALAARGARFDAAAAWPGSSAPRKPTPAPMPTRPAWWRNSAAAKNSLPPRNGTSPPPTAGDPDPRGPRLPRSRYRAILAIGAGTGHL